MTLTRSTRASEAETRSCFCSELCPESSISIPKAHLDFVFELVADGKAYRQFLTPGDAPEAAFKIDAEQATPKAWCNLHGLWEA